MPKRIQRKRVKGWKMPEGAVYVGRPTRWGNPFRREAAIEVGYGDGYGAAVDAYREWMRQPEQDALRIEAMTSLRGKDLACFCPHDKPCHADVLLQIVNPHR